MDRELWEAGMPEHKSLQTDEGAHSVEMRLPYATKAWEKPKVLLKLLH